MSLKCNYDDLLVAVSADDIVAVREVLADGIDLPVPDDVAFDILAEPVMAGEQEILRLLIGAGLDHEVAGDHGESLLMVAVGFPHHMIAKELLDRGLDVNRKDNIGQSALFYAVNSGDSCPEAVAVLLAAGADTHLQHPVYGRTPRETAEMDPPRVDLLAAFDRFEA